MAKRRCETALNRSFAAEPWQRGRSLLEVVTPPAGLISLNADAAPDPGGGGGVEVARGGLTAGAALSGCSADSTGLSCSPVNALIPFRCLKLLCKHEHSACAPRSDWERLATALGGSCKPVPPVLRGATLAPQCGQGWGWGDRAVAAAPSVALLQIDPQAGEDLAVPHLQKGFECGP